MKVQIFITLFLLYSFTAFAQDELKIFKTFKDYQNDKSISYEGDISYFGIINMFGKREVTFKNGAKNISKEEKKIPVDCRSVWGFSLNDALYKIIEDPKPHPMLVMAQDDLIYFENGLAHLSASRTFKKSGKYIGEIPEDASWGVLAAVSKDINSELITLKSNYVRNKKQFKKFKLDNPQFSGFLDCIVWNMPLKKVRKCYFDYFKIKGSTPFIENIKSM